MQRPLGARWKGHYFDGHSAGRHPVIIAVMRDGLHIRREDDTTLWWPFDQVRQTQGFIPGEQVRLERGGDLPEAIVVADAAFLAAMHQIAPQIRTRFHTPPRRSARLTLTLAAVAAIIALGSAIYLWGIPALADLAASRIPVAWEEQLGQAVVKGLTPPEKRCGDAARFQILDRISAILLAAAPQSPYTSRTTVVNDPAVNALAAPGGYLVIFRGLLEKTKTPEELAGVMAHEIQHVLQRHGTKALFREMSLRMLIAAVTGDAGGLASALEAAGALGGLRYRRSDEETADRDGMKMVQAARIDPQGMVAMYATLQREASDSPGALTYLSTHPRTADRLEQLKRLAAEARYTPIALLPGYDWPDIRKICG